MVEVLRGNSPTVRVYVACEWSLIAVMTGMAVKWVYRGIAAAEIDAAIRNSDIPKHRRARVFGGVRVMAQVAAPLLNDH